MYYYHAKNDKNGYVYSVDNVRVNFYLDRTQQIDFARYIQDLNRPDIEIFPTSFATFKYRNFVQVSYDSDVIMAVGLGFNGTNPSDYFKGYLDFNPNKVGNFEQFWKDLNFIRSHCRQWEICRIDFALDLPAPRDAFFVCKDHRVYETKIYSMSNRTEYLGRRSNVGYVKVYNKQIESNLDYPLTRVEVTCEPTLDSFKNNFPQVYDITLNNQLTSDFLALSDTQRFIVNAEMSMLSNGLDNGFVNFNSLGRKVKEKLKQFVMPEFSLVVFDTSVAYSVIADMCALLS